MKSYLKTITVVMLFVAVVAIITTSCDKTSVTPTGTITTTGSTFTSGLIQKFNGTSFKGSTTKVGDTLAILMNGVFYTGDSAISTFNVYFTDSVSGTVYDSAIIKPSVQTATSNFYTFSQLPGNYPTSANLKLPYGLYFPQPTISGDTKTGFSIYLFFAVPTTVKGKSIIPNIGINTKQSGLYLPSKSSIYTWWFNSFWFKGN